MRIERDFFANPPEDQKFFLDNTWCDSCGAADLGMKDLREYEEDDRIFVEGHCLKCGSVVRSKVTAKEANQ
jgi:hypothetical protein